MEVITIKINLGLAFALPPEVYAFLPNQLTVFLLRNILGVLLISGIEKRKQGVGEHQTSSLRL